MNIFNKILLKLVLFPSGLYTRMGVNVNHLKAILTTKLMMDDRRPNSFQQMQQKRRKKTISTATLSTMLMALIAGGLFAFISALLDNTLTKFTIYFSFYITFLASILIADFTSVLIDVRDSYIILPKPVTDRTFVLSRLLHIFIHVCKIVLPMALPGAVIFVINYGAWAIAAFAPMVLTATLFTIFLINACYILILKITTPQKFQNIISYIQIAFAIFFYACYQLVPRMMGRFSGLDISRGKAIILLPPFWFAGGWQQIYSPANSIQLWCCLLLSFAVPLFSLWLVIKYFAPAFNQKLAMIGGGTTEGTALNKVVKKEKSTSSYSQRLAGLITRHGAERSGFIFTWKMMLRSRDFKMKVYPAIGYMIVILVLMFFNMRGLTLNDISLQDDKGRIAILIVIYFSNLLLVSALGQITLSDKFKAAWVFFTAPVDVPGKILSGAIKAAISQFFFPVAAVTLIALISLAGISVIPNALFGICNELLITGVSAYFIADKLPFSSPQSIRSSSKGMLRVFSVMIIGSLLAVLQYILYKITPVIIILTILSAVASWMVFDSIKKYTWKKVQRRYEE